MQGQFAHDDRPQHVEPPNSQIEMRCARKHAHRIVQHPIAPQSSAQIYIEQHGVQLASRGFIFIKRGWNAHIGYLLKACSCIRTVFCIVILTWDHGSDWLGRFALRPRLLTPASGEGPLCAFAKSSASACSQNSASRPTGWPAASQNWQARRAISPWLNLIWSWPRFSLSAAMFLCINSLFRLFLWIAYFVWSPRIVGAFIKGSVIKTGVRALLGVHPYLRTKPDHLFETQP